MFVRNFPFVKFCQFTFKMDILPPPPPPWGICIGLRGFQKISTDPLIVGVHDNFFSVVQEKLQNDDICIGKEIRA